MDEYFSRNQAIFSPEEAKALRSKRVLVAGCGGLGNSVTELLARSGVGGLILADGDVYEPSNMNRQLFCTAKTLGRGKAETSAARVKEINPEIEVRAFGELITAENASALVRGCDLVMDALDSVPARLLLEDACAAEGVPLVHGAVNGWALQAGICPPGAGMLHALYRGSERAKGSGGVAVTVFACAAFQVSEALKLLLGREDVLYGKLMCFDLLCKESQLICF